MISNVATFSWGSLRLRSHVRLGAIVVIALLGGGLAVGAVGDAERLPRFSMLALIPFSIASLRQGQAAARQRRSAVPQPDTDATIL